MEILKLKNITKFYNLNNKKNYILQDINFTFNRGEIISILGESGSGKSTLLNIIGGLDNKYDGKVTYNNDDIKNDLDNHRKRNVGFVFQNFNLIPYLNLIENVQIPLLLTNFNRKKKRELAIEALTKVGLKEQIFKKPNQLSGGEKQRVAIARAIVKSPKILICDEPTGSLDSNNTREILKILISLAASGHTIIIATHSEQVSKISNKVITIKDGKICDTVILNEFLEFYEEKPLNNKSKKTSFISAILLSLKSTRQKLKRNMLVSIGTSIGIMGLLVVLSLSNSVKTFINDVVIKSKNDKILDVYKEKQDGNNLKSLSFELNDIKKFEALKYIDNIYYGYSEKGAFHLKNKEYRYDFDNIKTYSKSLKNEFLIEGIFPSEKEILINYYMYEKLENNLLNEHIILKNEDRDYIFKVSGIYEDGLNERNIYFNYDDINIVFSLKPNILFLETDDMLKLKLFVTKEGYFLSYIEESLKLFNETFDIIIYILGVASILSLMISSIMIMVVLYISVLERTKEIGTLRAFGFMKRDIKKIFISDGFLFGLSSGALGVILSNLILIYIDKFINKTFSIEINSINLTYIFVTLLLGILLSILSSLYPSKKASKLNIIDALRYE